MLRWNARCLDDRFWLVESSVTTRRPCRPAVMVVDHVRCRALDCARRDVVKWFVLAAGSRPRRRGVPASRLTSVPVRRRPSVGGRPSTVGDVLLPAAAAAGRRTGSCDGDRCPCPCPPATTSVRSRQPLKHVNAKWSITRHLKHHWWAKTFHIIFR